MLDDVGNFKKMFHICLQHCSVTSLVNCYPLFLGMLQTCTTSSEKACLFPPWCLVYVRTDVVHFIYFKKKNLKQKQNTMLLTISCQFVKMNTNRIRIAPNLMMYLAIIFTWATCSCFYNLVNMLVIFFRGMCYIAVLTEPITICNSFIWKPLPNTKMARELEQKWHHIIYVKKKRFVWN